MELNITADWVLSTLSEDYSIEANAFWMKTSGTIFSQNSNCFWIIKAIEELGIVCLDCNYTQIINGIEYQIFEYGITFKDMERIKDEIPETYYSYYNLRYSK